MLTTALTTALLASAALAADLVPKLGVGIPGLVNAHVELRQPRWAVEAGVGVGLLPPAWELAARWRPARTCWALRPRDELALSPGVQALAIPINGGAAVILAPDLELAWTHRLGGPLGFTLGTRWGMGLTTELGGGRDWTRIEPGGNIVLAQAGLVIAL